MIDLPAKGSYMKNFSNKDIYEIDWAYTDRQKYLRSIPRTWKERRVTRFIVLGAGRQVNAMRQWWAAGQRCLQLAIQNLLAPTTTMTVRREGLDVHGSASPQ